MSTFNFPDLPAVAKAHETLVSPSFNLPVAPVFSNDIFSTLLDLRRDSPVAESVDDLNLIATKVVELREVAETAASKAGERDLSRAEIVSLDDGRYRRLIFMKRESSALFEICECQNSNITIDPVDLILDRAEWDEAVSPRSCLGGAIAFALNKRDIRTGTEFSTTRGEGYLTSTLSIIRKDAPDCAVQEELRFKIDDGVNQIFEMDFNRGLVSLHFPFGNSGAPTSTVCWPVVEAELNYLKHFAEPLLRWAESSLR